MHLHLFGQFSDHNSGRKHGFALTVCKIHFLYLKIVKIHFHAIPPFGSFWSVKRLNFGQKLPIRTTHHTFLESIHPDVINPYYVLSPEGSQKKGYQLMD